MNEPAKGSITRGQIRKLHALKKALRLRDEDYRITLEYNYGVTTSKALSREEAEALIAEFERLAVQAGVWTPYQGKGRYEDLAGRPGMASPAQLRKLEALWKEATGIRKEERRARAFRKFLTHYFHVSDLRFLTSGKARKVMKALEEMKARKAGAPDGSQGEERPQN
jgi:hypothetical protein